ncbi:phage tail protein [Pseudomonas sp. Root9]|uniref:phage tail tape measure protein n=1 Tax=Pseudomonas sp. Root9 TaxID=1736604 RepID=UPI0006F1F75E|nr:phage tail tape measure protein [Pseudomonas sp. Root9]KRC96432.1 phage tail protein [Pseudomonas sp. Root9]
MNIAQLGIRIDSADAIEAKSSLEDMAKAGGRAEKSMLELEQVLSKGAKTTQELAKQRDALAKLTATAAYGEKELAKFAKDLDKSQLALAKSAMEDQKALNSLLGAIDPARAALAKLDAQVDLLNKSYREGGVDQATFAAGMKKFDAQYATLERSSTAFDKMKLGSRQAQENVMQLGNAISSGDWGSGARAITQLGVGAGASMSSMLALVAPIGLVTAAIGGLAYAYYSGNKETDAFNKALILTGNYAGTTSGNLSDMARQVAATVGTTGAAADVLATLAGSGKLASGSFVEIAEAALSMEEATGKSIDATVAEFVKIADDPVAAAKSLNEQYHFLTASVYSQIVALKDQGNEIGATKLLTDTYADTVQTRSRQVIENLNLWERAWLGIKSAASGALDGISDVGRQKSYKEQIKELRATLTGSEAFDVGGVRMNAQEVSPKVRAQTEAQIRFLELQSDADEARIKYFDDEAKAQQAAIIAGDKVDALTKSSLTNEQKRTKEIKDYKEWLDTIRKANPADARLEGGLVTKNIQNINDRYKDPKTGGSSAVDLTGFNDAKNNLADIVNDYKNAHKELEAAQKAGLVSQGDYATRSAALIKQESVDVAAAYGAEISALEATKAKKSTTAAQSIQLDQRIADARQSMVKAQKDADSQLDILAKSEIGRQKRQTASLNNYVDALNLQTEALRNAGQRAALGVGMGDRQNALNGELNAQGDRYASASRELANQRSEASLRGVSTGDLDKEFGPRVDALAKQNQQATEQIKQNYADLQTAQGDWTKGATSAWENYLDSAQNVAGQTKSLFGNAFNSMEDAVVNFAMTGKLSFADFTKSILADMARIATRQAASGALGALFGAGASAAGSYFGGSTVTSTSGFSDYGQITSVNAKGNVFDGPGISAYSNSIVSSPTVFPFAKGTGLMGEAGPEAIMPLTRTSSGKLGVMAAGGGGGGNTYTFPVSVSVDTNGDSSATGGATPENTEAFGKAVQEAARFEAQQAISAAMRQGGSIWRAMNGR